MKAYSERQGFYPDGYVTKGCRLSPKQVFLSERCCVTTDGRFYIKTKTGSWEYVTTGKVASQLMTQNWIGGKLQIAPDDIKKFIAGDPPVVRGAMPVPTSDAPCIEFQGSTYINTWRNTFLPADPEALHDPVAREGLTLLMRVLRENLCGRDGELSLDAMLAAAASDDPEELEFRFAMSFFAKLVQEPGFNLQVNLWWLGDLQGVGKGVFTSYVLTRLLGPHNVAILDPAEIEHGGWNDKIEGKLIVVINELRPVGKWGAFWNNFIKKHSTDTTVPIRKRNTNSHDALNFANWIITSNNESPGYLDPNDRRNALIATTTDAGRPALATKLYDWMRDHEGPELDRMLGGFMHLLLAHKVDYSLLVNAPDTLLKQDAVEGASEDGEGLWWLENSSRYPRDVWKPADDSKDDFLRVTPSLAPMDTRTMGKILSTLARHGHVQRKQKSKTHRALYLISNEKFPASGGTEKGSKAGSASPFSVYERGFIRREPSRNRKDKTTEFCGFPARDVRQWMKAGLVGAFPIRARFSKVASPTLRVLSMDIMDIRI